MQTVSLKDHGILPNTDITLALHKLFERYPRDTEFVFEEADYYFSPHSEMFADYRLSNSDPMPYRVLAVWMKNMKNCRLRGNNARLWLSGHMQVFTLDHCTDIAVEGFTVNWKKPLVAEGVVADCGDGYIDVAIDGEKFPHRLVGDKLEFDVGNGEWYETVGRLIAFEPYSHTVRRGTGDFGVTRILDRGNGLWRMMLDRSVPVQTGDLLNIRHNKRIHAGVFSEKCERLTVENVTFHSCGGLGCLSQFCKDVTFRAVNFLPDTRAGRFVSCGRDDGMHITCNRGTVTITECNFHALMDDPINVHGCCVISNEAVDERTLRCRYCHPQAGGFHYWAEEGDTIAFINRGAMNSVGTARAEAYIPEDYYTFLLRFDRPLPEEILNAAKKGDALALDNLSNTAAFICTKNRFGSCRARGVLVSTPKPVKITDNYFESSGSAVLVAGDSNYWFESGACHDVEISRNIFSNLCLTSEYQFCDGIISITPVVPEPRQELPYHSNIRITSNIFDTADAPVLSAFSCEKLVFDGNRIFSTPSAECVLSHDRDIRLSFCRDARVSNNEWICRRPPEISAENCKDIY